MDGNVAQGLQLYGDLTGLDVGALLRRISGSAGTDGVSRIPVVADGDGALDGHPPRGR